MRDINQITLPDTNAYRPRHLFRVTDVYDRTWKGRNEKSLLSKPLL